MSKSRLITTFSTLALLIVLGLIAWWLITSKPKEATKTGTQVFQHKLYPYSLQYQADWQIEPKSGDGDVTYVMSPVRAQAIKENKSPRLFDVMVRTYPNSTALPGNSEKKLSFSDWLRDIAPTFPLKDKKETVIAGQKAHQWEGTQLGQRILFFEHNGLIYHVETGEVPTPDQERIISSLSFTQP